MTVLLPTHMMAQIEEEVIFEPTSRRNLAQTSTVRSSLRAESFHEQFVEEPADEVKGTSIASRVNQWFKQRPYFLVIAAVTSVMGCCFMS